VSLLYIVVVTFVSRRAASGVLLFFLRGREGSGEGREELSGFVCVCVSCLCEDVSARLDFLIMCRMILICRILLFVQMILHSEEGICCWGFVDD
jgi:hypothetical protein